MKKNIKAATITAVNFNIRDILHAVNVHHWKERNVFLIYFSQVIDLLRKCDFNAELWLCNFYDFRGIFFNIEARAEHPD